ncbi:hypothetical protein DPMN_002786 [Dreissena polymorpha]|uniref:Uncharacterized protein n=1 Tax=Dreissena polymorpha TaxID=45954 RepID=A0A9D4MKC9_DREPO|nr:hypothetical protein DPMN_002786 [Dreissena polymorpha]
MYLMELHILSGERSRSSFKVKGQIYGSKVMVTMTPVDFHVTRYIDHDSQMTPIDFEVTRSKVKCAIDCSVLQLYVQYVIYAICDDCMSSVPLIVLCYDCMSSMSFMSVSV